MKILKSGFLLTLLLLFGCKQKQNVKDSVVLKIDAIEMTTEQFSVALANHLKHLDAFVVKDTKYIEKTKQTIINDFIVRSISELWAQEQGLFVKTSEINQEIDRVRANYGDDISFREELAKEQITLKEWRKKIRDQLLQEKILQKLREDIVPPTEKELKTYYQTNKETFSYSESVKLRQIVLKSQSDANMVMKKLRRGSSMDELSKYSVTPDSENKGHLGWIEKGVTKYFDKVFNTRVGSFAPIVQSEYGFHIIQVLGKRNAGVYPYESVKDKIVRTLMEKREQAKYVAWLDAQFRKIKFYKNDEIINKISVVTKGST
ncbi:MAG: peptidyl-prolyl cis-trans isomerase [Bdellovibrionales bacterium]|nr:peptidyl-prolyl cis-trans isomerase [Bdellovibrionales bacterium]